MTQKIQKKTTKHFKNDSKTNLKTDSTNIKNKPNTPQSDPQNPKNNAKHLNKWFKQTSNLTKE